MNKKNALILLSLAAAGLYLLNGTDSFSQKVQGWIGSAYANIVELAVSVVFFFALGLALLAADLPLLVVVGVIVATSYAAYKVAGWFSFIFGNPGAFTMNAGATTQATNPAVTSPDANGAHDGTTPDPNAGAH